MKGTLGQGVSAFPASVEVAGEKRLQNSWTVSHGMSDTHSFSELILVSPNIRSKPAGWVGLS